MGHSTLIGWYNPNSKRFCYKDEKETRPEHFKGYKQPVYAVLEEGMRRDLEAENKRLKELVRCSNCAYWINEKCDYWENPEKEIDSLGVCREFKSKP